MEDASHAIEDEGEQSVTIKEYIEEMEEEELAADLVLGGDEGKECTYSKGYMKRQAIFSCLSCVPDGNAGFCTACILVCHDGHEVVELWTKRNFKCDCGNSKFGEFYCKLYANKDPENTANSYNQNFKGSYCTCGRPYPDPQADEQVEMIQCCICEDWFHENHLGLDFSEEIPRTEDGEPLYDEFICEDCSLTCSFLKLYPATIWATLKQINEPVKRDDEANVLECGSSTSAYLNKTENGIPPMGTVTCTSSKSNEVGFLIGENSAESLGSEKAKSDIPSSSKCILGLDISATSFGSEKKKPMFLSKRWREILCSCIACRKFYIKMGVDFLIEKEDSIEEYEKIAKRKREEKLQQEEGAELNFLNGLGPVQKIEIMSGIADMKNEFQSFLESFDSSKPVTTEDVRGIFENLSKKNKEKRQKLM